jgi:DNA/RNA endonuclease G (NUC1)
MGILKNITLIILFGLGIVALFLGLPKQATTQEPTVAELKKRYKIWCHFPNSDTATYSTKHYTYESTKLKFTVDNQDGREVVILNPTCTIAEI